MAIERKALTVCLAAVLVSFLLVGVVSSTLLRHVIQVIPLAVMLLLNQRRAAFVACPSMAIFAIWFLLMLLIWLYLFGIVTFFGGSFSPIEIVLTVVIGAFSAAGIRESVRLRSAAIAHCLAAFAMGAVLQIAAMWVSFMPAFANR